ncbi:MAG: WYL domain-containing protein [Desulfurivibrionaceae bacterium]|nr:WYL domain-containing protein [Desulfobulbales bacterium]MDT8334829.1 WYL domain-containing protein [Desulfurivibrionaceae bacterium]
MTKHKTQFRRLIFVDQQVREGMRKGQLANCRRMAAAYEVSPKTIMRDMDYLKNQCDAPLSYDRSRHGYYYTEENYQLPAIKITESDLLAICLTRKIMEQHRNTPIYGKLAAVFDRIEKSLPDRITISPAWIDDRISVLGDSRADIDPLIWETVAKTLHHYRRLRISYLKPGATENSERRIDPYHVVSFQGEWYLIGFCHLREEIRIFAISRIKRAKALQGRFVIPADFNLDDFTDAHFGLFRGVRQHQVEIRFSPKIAPYIMERDRHPEQTMAKRADGALVVSFKTRHLLGVKRWILSWGSDAEVLAPEELRAEIRREIRKNLQAYNQ